MKDVKKLAAMKAFKTLATSSGGNEDLIPDGVTRSFNSYKGLSTWVLPLNKETVEFAFNILVVEPNSMMTFKHKDGSRTVRRINQRFEVSGSTGLNDITPFNTVGETLDFVERSLNV